MSAEIMREPSDDELRAARATAYVLGELPPGDVEAFEREIAGDAALAAEVDELREMSGMLSRELGRDAPVPEPTSQVKPMRALGSSRRGRWLGAFAAAAAFGVAIPGYLLWRDSEMSGGGYLAPISLSERESTQQEWVLAEPRVTSVDMPAHPARLDALGPADAAAAAAPKSRIAIRSEAPTGNSFGGFDENPFVLASAEAQSTFSIDVDTASYAIIRSHLESGALPPKQAVRIEEMLNYFSYAYPRPTSDVPFSINLDMAVAPWAEKNRLVRIGLRGKDVALEEKRGANLVFLIDTSGSMNAVNKLQLLRQSLKLLLPKLGENDRVSIVTYAGSAGLVLAPTRGDKREAIEQALDRLEAGGSTNGGSGIALAYDVAKRQFIQGGVNRVILCTDGDFNVGVTSATALVDMVAARAKTGVFLSVLGFGMGNLKDATLEQIADKGDGNYAYIDTLEEGRKVLAEGLGTLVTIAKDVKLQITFDPTHVESYRLLGYENRVMHSRDFHDDGKDAGELGSGHTVTALYEIVPRIDGSTADYLKVELRYKAPEGGASKLVSAEIGGDDASARPSADFRFAAGVAAFGMMLRDSPHKGTADWAMVERLVQVGIGSDETGRRKELLDLVKRSAALKAR